MTVSIKIIISKTLPVFDKIVVFIPITFLSGYYLKGIRRCWGYLPWNQRLLQNIGVVPIRDHYYEPIISRKQLNNASETEGRESGAPTSCG